MVAPEKENPNTVEVNEILSPFSPASPPEADIRVTPSTLNWKPEISVLLS